MFKQLFIMLIITYTSAYEYTITLNSIPTKIIVNIHDDIQNECPVEVQEFTPPLPNHQHPDDMYTPSLYDEPILKVQPRKVYNRKLQHVELI